MAQRRFIVLGDKTSHGGTVVTASSHMTIDDIQVACVGDKVTCPRCKGTHTILGSGKNTVLDDNEMACEGDPVSDGSVLMSVLQSNATHDVGEGLAEVIGAVKAKAASAAAPAEPATATPGSDFCLPCFLKSLSQRGFVTPVPDAP